jgi:hypothetical protein
MVMGEVFFNTDVNKNVDIQKNVTFDVVKNASAETAEAFLFRDAAASAQVTTDGAFSFSDSLAATNVRLDGSLASAEAAAAGFAFSESLSSGENYYVDPEL